MIEESDDDSISLYLHFCYFFHYIPHGHFFHLKPYKKLWIDVKRTKSWLYNYNEIYKN